MHIESGAARHTVDFTDYALGAGDVLWVRAGQVHQWGAIADIEGPVAMFGPHTVDERTRDLIRSQLVRPRSHWPAADLTGTPVSQALALLVLSGNDPTNDESAQVYARSRLPTASPRSSSSSRSSNRPAAAPAPGPTHEAYTWFRDHIEEHFRSWHQVSQYADRLGYSTRTLNRLARQHTGLSAKELIDERVVLEAKRQLSHADASVSEIAEQLGFDDASNFSSYFRRQTRLTPGTFRTQSRIGTAPAT